MLRPSEIELKSKSRIRIRGDEDQGLGSSEYVWTSPVPIALLVKSAMPEERSVQGWRRAKHKTYSPLDDYRVILLTSNAFTCYYFRAGRDEIHFDFLPSLVCCRHRRPGKRFLRKHILETKFHQSWTKAQSMTKERQLLNSRTLNPYPVILYSLWYST